MSDFQKYNNTKVAEGTIFRCKRCGLLWIDQTKLVPCINNYVHGLDTITLLRKQNNEKILQRLKTVLSADAEGLEVGSAIGLFLEQSKAQGFRMTGIEPMNESYLIAAEKGLNVTHGFSLRIFRGHIYMILLFLMTFLNICRNRAKL